MMGFVELTGELQEEEEVWLRGYVALSVGAEESLLLGIRGIRS